MFLVSQLKVKDYISNLHFIFFQPHNIIKHKLQINETQWTHNMILNINFASTFTFLTRTLQNLTKT